jgi:hypothetical protein
MLNKNEWKKKMHAINSAAYLADKKEKEIKFKS